jgi:TonB family protein
VSAALALSAALHAVMLAGAPAPSGAGPAPAAPPAALQVRLVTAQAPAAAAPSSGTAKAPPRASAVKTGPQPRAADGPRYWRASELDSKPIPLTPIEPSAPASAGGKPGRVLARVLIDESGRADAVRVELSEPQAIFDEAVKNAFGAARYRPGMKGGRSVKSQMLVEITFHGKDERPADSALPR